VIVESIVTTVAPDGAVNIAPMGVEWGDDALVLKPFLETTTWKNVRASGVAVVNLTDDVYIFAAAAIGSPSFPTVPAAVVPGVVLEAACSWREVEITETDATPPRARLGARVVHRGTHREFIGFNRARHAVLEAAILCTRLHLIPPADVDADFARLRIPVEKTAGPREWEAWRLLERYREEHRERRPEAAAR
jgi:hypothetical protein